MIKDAIWSRAQASRSGSVQRHQELGLRAAVVLDAELVEQHAQEVDRARVAD
jgi:hypothetical protein